MPQCPSWKSTFDPPDSLSWVLVLANDNAPVLKSNSDTGPVVPIPRLPPSVNLIFSEPDVSKRMAPPVPTSALSALIDRFPPLLIMRAVGSLVASVSISFNSGRVLDTSSVLLTVVRASYILILCEPFVFKVISLPEPAIMMSSPSPSVISRASKSSENGFFMSMKAPLGPPISIEP